MSKPILDEPQPKNNAKVQRVALILAVVVPSIAAAIALPSLVGGDDVVEQAIEAPPSRQKKPATDRPGTGESDVDGQKPTDAEVAGPDVIATSEDGDLSVSLRLRWDSVTVGAQIRGKLEISNHGLTAVHVPAPGESFPTLAIVVLDGEGNEVRRVLEAGADDMPRNTVEIPSGASHEMVVAVQTGDDDPLPPGDYTALVAMGAHPGWVRTGLDFWTGPKGVVRSEGVRFSVTQ